MKNITRFVAFVSLFVVSSLSVFAHVTVKPSEVVVGKYTTFTVSVPVEKDMPTTGVRLIIPAGVEKVTPNMKIGWRIEMIKSKENKDVVQEIRWTGNAIPAGQRDEFVFSAKTPATATTLQWTAYQTYRDGSVVDWDVDPTAASEVHTDEKSDFSKSGPFSVTTVVDDLTSTGKVNSGNVALTLSVIAVILSVVTMGVALGRRS